MKTHILAIFLFTCVCADAIDTNIVFVTDDGFLISQNRYGAIKMNPKKIEEARHLKECLPTSEFPEGNWGVAKSGFQLSLRFDKQAFGAGEPITATILVRNITNETLVYNISSVIGQSSPIALVVADKSGKQAALKSDDIILINSHSQSLFPQTQRKYREEITGVYNLLTNQMYYVSANLNVSCPRCVVVESAKVPIQIVGSP